jgi:hypothetical protein
MEAKVEELRPKCAQKYRRKRLMPIRIILGSVSGEALHETLAGYGCVLNFLPSFLQMRRMIVFPELALWARDPILVAHTPTK